MAIFSSFLVATQIRRSCTKKIYSKILYWNGWFNNMGRRIVAAFLWFNLCKGFIWLLFNLSKVSRRKFPFQFSWLNKIKDFSAFLFSSKMILFVTLFDVTAHLDWIFERWSSKDFCIFSVEKVLLESGRNDRCGK